MLVYWLVSSIGQPYTITCILIFSNRDISAIFKRMKIYSIHLIKGWWLNGIFPGLKYCKHIGMYLLLLQYYWKQMQWWNRKWSRRTWKMATKVKLITCFHDSWIYEYFSRNFVFDRSLVEAVPGIALSSGKTFLKKIMS